MDQPPIIVKRYCPDCGIEMEVEKRRYGHGKRCVACKKKAAGDPIRLLKRRFYNSARKMWPEATHLWSTETVRAVFTRCEGKSVESGNDNVEILCIYSKKRSRESEPTVDDLVLLTSKEARTRAVHDREKE